MSNSPPPVEPSGASDLASDLSKSLPDYLLNLGHEPSVVLHFGSNHARSRVAPTLAKLTKHFDHRTTMISNLTLDAKDSVSMI